MADNDYTDIVVIVDKSGSMSPLVESTISGFNEFLKEQQGAEGRATLSMVQFDNEYERPYTGLKIEHVKPLDTTSYVPRGGTAMNDAIMRALQETEARHASMPEEEQPGKTVVVIITDGMENASKEFGGVWGTEQVQTRVKALQEEKDWQFAFFAANIDAKHVAQGYGISGAMAMNYTPDAAGVQGTYAVMSSALCDYRSSRGVGAKMKLQPDDFDVSDPVVQDSTGDAPGVNSSTTDASS